ncbi:MAG: M28 family peptidase [bacterium]|nr:MAG: M28 family peptidase [bacterium]
MSIGDDLRIFMNRLTVDSPDRFIGSRGHRRAFSYIKGLVRSWGYWSQVHPFSVDLTVPLRWSLQIDLGKGFEEVESLPGIGSPSTDLLEGDIRPVGYAREEDYSSLDSVEGSVHLAKLWKSHETVKIQEAARQGARALIWYNEYFDEIYSGACDYSLAPVPGFSIRKSVAERITEAGGARVRIRLKSKRRRIRCRNIEAGTGPTDGRYALLTAHYDSRPRTPGASDDASGIAVMLAFMKGGYEKDLSFPMRYLFADCEEVGCVGAEHHAAELYRTNRLKDISSVVNLDAVGWPNLCVITRDREAVMDEGLSHLACDTLSDMGYQAERVRSKTGKSNHTPFAMRGIPCLWLSDYPNYIRHSAIDNAFNIDYPTMTMVTEALKNFYGKLD